MGWILSDPLVRRPAGPGRRRSADAGRGGDLLRWPVVAVDSTDTALLGQTIVSVPRVLQPYRVPAARYTSPAWAELEHDPPVAAHVADRRHRRPRRRAGRLVRVPGRLAVGHRAAHRGRLAAGVPERVPAPGQRPRVRRGPRPHRAALRVPPVVLGPRRRAARGAVAAGLRHAAQRGARPHRGAGRRVGAARVREPRPRGRAVRGLPRGACRSTRRGSASPTSTAPTTSRCRCRATGRR